MQKEEPKWSADKWLKELFVQGCKSLRRPPVVLGATEHITDTSTQFLHVYTRQKLLFLFNITSCNHRWRDEEESRMSIMTGGIQSSRMTDM